MILLTLNCYCINKRNNIEFLILCASLTAPGSTVCNWVRCPCIVEEHELKKRLKWRPRFRSISSSGYKKVLKTQSLRYIHANSCSWRNFECLNLKKHGSSKVKSRLTVPCEGTDQCYLPRGFSIRDAKEHHPEEQRVWSPSCSFWSTVATNIYGLEWLLSLFFEALEKGVPQSSWHWQEAEHVPQSFLCRPCWRARNSPTLVSTSVSAWNFEHVEMLVVE